MFQVIYDAPDGVRTYCQNSMDRLTAERMLKLFSDKYLTTDGKGKPYPNGQGYYPFTNPRIVPIQ